MATPTFELIERVVASSVSEVTFTGIPDTYKHLVMITHGHKTSGTSMGRVRLNGGSGSTDYRTAFIESNGSTINASSINDNGWYGGVNYGIFASATLEGVTIHNIYNYADATSYTTASYQGGGVNEGTGLWYGTWRQTAAVTSISYALTWSSVNCALYGLVG
jgi:hypothetical protein